MKTLKITTLLFFNITLLATSQNLDPGDAASVNGLNKAFYNVINRQPIQKEGLIFIDENFYITNLNSYTLGDLYNTPARYDLFTHQFEVAVQSSRFGLKGNLIKSFSWYNTNTLKKAKFINVKEFKTPREMNGFFEVLIEGEASLFAFQEVIYFRGSQSPSVNKNAGTESMSKVTEYYVLVNDKVQKVHKGRKKNTALFGSHNVEMTEYMKKQKLNPKNINDLSLIVKKYNNLLTK